MASNSLVNIDEKVGSFSHIDCGGIVLKNVVDYDLKMVLEEGNAHAAVAGSMFVYYGRLKTVRITAPSEIELTEVEIYNR